MPSVPNFKLVTPEERAKLRPLLAHYAKSAHPFTLCVAENRKRFGPRTEQVCAVVKDLIKGTTKWRGKEMSEGQLRTALVELSRANIGRVTVERDQDPDVIELASSNVVPIKVKVTTAEGATVERPVMVELAFNADQPRDPLGRWREVVGQLQGLAVGQKKKVGKSFEVEKVAAAGDRKYRVTMKTPAGQDDRRVYAETAADAADAALGVSPAQASSQAAKIRSYNPKTGPSKAEQARNAAIMHGGRSKQARKARKRARGELSVGQARAAIVELSKLGKVELSRDTDPDVIELASSGLVPVKVTVHRKNGTTFQRTMMVRPNQAKAMKAGKGGQQVSVKGLKASRHETRVLQELAKIPKVDRPAGWDRVVRAVATGPSHGGRLGPEKRRLLRDLQANAPAGSPLKAAVTAALKADAKPVEKPKAKPKHKTTQGRATRAAGKVVAGGR